MPNSVRATRLATNPWSLGPQDLLIVSAFGIWSVILGLSPVLAYHALAWH
jgi:hypothetical protein